MSASIKLREETEKLFRKHESKTNDFKSSVNAIRGNSKTNMSTYDTVCSRCKNELEVSKLMKPESRRLYCGFCGRSLY